MKVGQEVVCINDEHQYRGFKHICKHHTYEVIKVVDGCVYLKGIKCDEGYVAFDESRFLPLNPNDWERKEITRNIVRIYLKQNKI